MIYPLSQHYRWWRLSQHFSYKNPYWRNGWTALTVGRWSCACKAPCKRVSGKTTGLQRGKATSVMARLDKCNHELEGIDETPGAKYKSEISILAHSNKLHMSKQNASKISLPQNKRGAVLWPKVIKNLLHRWADTLQTGVWVGKYNTNITVKYMEDRTHNLQRT